MGISLFWGRAPGCVSCVESVDRKRLPTKTENLGHPRKEGPGGKKEKRADLPALVEPGAQTKDGVKKGRGGTHAGGEKNQRFHGVEKTKGHQYSGRGGRAKKKGNISKRWGRAPVCGGKKTPPAETPH